MDKMAQAMDRIAKASFLKNMDFESGVAETYFISHFIYVVK
jgi:hypothetical protein